MIKLRTTPDNLVNKRVIFHHTNTKITDRFYKQFYGELVDVIWDDDHSACLAVGVNKYLKFFLTAGTEMNAHIYNIDDDPEMFL